MKKYKEAKQDAYEGITESFKPIIDVQKSVKESIDEKQDKLITQLQKNQKAITSGLEDIFIYNQLPIDDEPAMMDDEPDDEPPPKISDIDKGFNPTDIETLNKYKQLKPSDVLKGVQNKTLDFNDYDENIGKILGRQKAVLSKKSLKNIPENVEKIAAFNDEIKSLRKYRERISIIPEGLKTIGLGSHYTQKKRNAYKVNPQTGGYGNIKIDLPKLFGQLKVIAHMDGKKVYDKQADFDTIDLLTKRFNSKKEI